MIKSDLGEFCMNYNNGSNLNEMYDYYLVKVLQENNNDHVPGVWIKYDGSKLKKLLLQVLQEKKVDRDIYKGFVKNALSKGDIYIYYTKDWDGSYRKPSIYINAYGNDIILNKRLSPYNKYYVDPSILVALTEKMGEFSNRGQYIEYMYGTYIFNRIYQKIHNNLELTKEDIKYLYDMSSPTWLMMKKTNPTINKFIKTRDVKSDLAYLFDCKVENIGTKLEDFEKNDIICFVGDLWYRGEFVPDNFKHLKCILGIASFDELISAEGLDNLQIIGKGAYFNNLTIADGLNSLQIIGGPAYFNKLIDSKYLENLQIIVGSAFFNKLTSAGGLSNLQFLGRSVDFSELTSAEGLDNLQIIGGSAGLSNLTDAKGLENLQFIGQNALCNNMTNLYYFKELMLVGGNINCDNLEYDLSYFTNLRSVNGRPAEEFISGIEKRNNSLKHKAVKILKRGKR